MINKPMCVACWCVLVAGLPMAGAAGSLDAPCPIDWRAVSLGQAVRELAKRVGMPYILDPSVTEEVLDRPVRLTAAHLDGRGAFRWTVRAAGMEVAFVEDTVIIARPDRLPVLWRTGPEPGEPAAAASRRATLKWVDAPLSAYPGTFPSSLAWTWCSTPGSSRIRR